VKVVVLLADKGTNNFPRGTLNLLNVGWGVTQLQPTGITPPHALAVFFEADLAECNRQFEVTIDLVGEDGSPVQIPSPAGPQPLRIVQPLLIPSPGGAPTGTVGRGNFMIESSPGLPVAPGTYTWRVSVSTNPPSYGSTSFYVAAPPQLPQFSFGVGMPPTGPEPPTGV
jgi:hypothetical protein